MSESVENSFDSLVEALAEAVNSASALTEMQHLDRIHHFFDEEGMPKMLKFQNPLSIDKKVFAVPEICLSPLSSIQIAEIEIEVKVKMDKIMNGRGPKGNKKCLGIDSTSFLPSSKEKIKLRIKFVSRDVPEGFARLIENYIKVIP